MMNASRKTDELMSNLDVISVCGGTSLGFEPNFELNAD
jgi:hypothetical protein